MLVPEQRQDRETVIRFIRDPDPATEFAVKGIDGGAVNLAAARGKVVLLNFWATWCGPCRMEVPDLVELQKKYRDRLQVIGLVVDDADEDAVRKFAKRYSINYPVAMATDDMRIQFGGVPALPTSFIVDSQGRAVQKRIQRRLVVARIAIFTKTWPAFTGFANGTTPFTLTVTDIRQ